jgi:hypothetical protein
MELAPEVVWLWMAAAAFAKGFGAAKYPKRHPAQAKPCHVIYQPNTLSATLPKQNPAMPIYQPNTLSATLPKQNPAMPIYQPNTLSATLPKQNKSCHLPANFPKYSPCPSQALLFNTDRIPTPILRSFRRTPNINRFQPKVAVFTVRWGAEKK